MLLLAVIAGVAAMPAASQQDTIRARVDLVVVPASVRDADGKFVYDLQREDFSILEDGRPQEVSQFSIDPLPLSATVLIDTGVGGKALRRFASSIVSLGGSFTDIDEVEIYRFDETIRKVSDFTNSPETVSKNLASIQEMAQRRGEGDPAPPVVLPGRGPRWLRWFLDRGNPKRALNEALFAAAADLENRKPETRKIVIVISDGQTWSGNVASALAQTRQWQAPVYVVGVGTTTGAMIPLPAVYDPNSPPPVIRAVLDRDSLRQIARAGGGEYFELGVEPDRDVAARIITSVKRRAKIAQVVESNEDLYWEFLFAAAVVLCLGTLMLREAAELWWHIGAVIATLAVLSALPGLM